MFVTWKDLNNPTRCGEGILQSTLEKGHCLIVSGDDGIITTPARDVFFDLVTLKGIVYTTNNNYEVRLWT